MKTYGKMSRIIVALLAISMLVAACKKDDDEDPVTPPQISLIDETGYISADAIVAAGDEIKVKVEFQKGSLNITNFIIKVMTDTEQTYFDTGMNTTGLIWEGSFTKSNAPTEEWTFIARDIEGNSSSTGFVITLDTSAQYTPLSDYGQLVFGAQDNVQTGGCYDIMAQSIYTHQAATADTIIQSGIDMIYYYIDTDKNTIASSGANIEDGVFPVNPSTWTITRESRYYKTGLTADDFNMAVNDSIILANYEQGDAKRKAKNLKSGDIYTFKTEDGTLGIFLVDAVDGTNEGSINISLKIQE